MSTTRAELSSILRPSLAFLGALLVVLVFVAGCKKQPAGTTAGGAGGAGDVPVLYAIPAFALTDQRGDAFGNEQVEGKVWLANFIFTRCNATCPTQTAHLARLQKRLADHPRNGEIRLVSFSVDPGFDKPQVLTTYAQAAGADLGQWSFLTGTREAIWELSVKGFKLPVGENKVNSSSPLFHSPKLILVDRDGRVRGYYDGISDEGIDAAERGLEKVLAEAEPPASAPPAKRAPAPEPEAAPAAESTPPQETKPPAGTAVDSTNIPVPEDLFKTPWLQRRRQAQLATTADFDVFHGFSFADERERSGIDFRHRIVDDAGRTYKAAHYDHGNGVAVADVDGDGLPDIYFSNQVGANELWRNLGDGKFEDITASAGVAVTQPIGVTASFADTDNDGDPDLYVTTVRGGSFFFENDGSGKFENVTQAAGLEHVGHSSGAVFFDYDRDGLVDLLLTNVGVYTSDLARTVTPDGIHADQDKTEFTFYSAYEDAFAGHLKTERDEPSILYRNTGNNVFEDVTGTVGLTDMSYSGDATPIDLNEDGWLDLYLLNMQGHDQYFENDGGTRFLRKSREVFPRTPWGSMGIEVLDFENDGDFDIYITDMHSDMSEDVGPDQEKVKSNMQWPESLLRSGGQSIFGNAFFRNTGNGTFEEISDAIGAENYWPWGLSVGDLNADGFEDVFIASSMNYPFRYGINSVLLNNRGERFLDSEFILGVEPRRGSRTCTPYFALDCSGDDWGHRECEDREGRIIVWSALGSRSSVIFDLDGDGDLDIVTNDFNSHPMVLVSDLTDRTSVHYLGVVLIGTASNRGGLGAVVTVRAGAQELKRVNDGKSGYLSQSVLPLYFGLGEADTVDEIEITWPSGGTQTVAGPIPANRLMQITEE